MASVANSDIVDLCFSDDEAVAHGQEVIFIDEPLTTAAKAPRVSLDDDGSGDEVRVVFPPGQGKESQRRKRRLRHCGYADREEVDPEPDRKPAARPRYESKPCDAIDVEGSNIQNLPPVARLGQSSTPIDVDSTSQKESAFETVDLNIQNFPPLAGMWLSSVPVDVDEIPDMVITHQVNSTKPKSSLNSVLEVFPDADSEYVKKLLHEQGDCIPVVLSLLLDKAYPKQKYPLDLKVSIASSLVVKRNKALPKFDYRSSSSFEPTPGYIAQATQQLSFEFPFLSCQGISRILQENHNHYSIARRHLLDTLMGKQTSGQLTEEEENSQYYALKEVLTTKNPSAAQRRRFGPDALKRRRYASSRPSLDDPILKDELKYATEELDGWMSTVEQRIKRVQDRQMSLYAGNGMECSCCFVEVALDEMVACRDEGHLFCVDCIKSYAETQVFSAGTLGINKVTKKPALELLCCHGDGCQSPFQEEHLQKALTYKILEKYNELQFKAAIEQAGMLEDLCTCPKCGFQADLPPTQMIFQCPMEDCLFESCRKCGKEPHIPLRCEEVVQKKHEDEGRLKVEEAISEAKIRKCPKCHTSFVKSDGCNKMTCRCGVKMCYICRQQLHGTNPYSHFCQVPHCNHKSCGNCTLYSNAEQDDERAMREAGLVAAKTYLKEVRHQNESINIQIDVDKIMKGPRCRL